MTTRRALILIAAPLAVALAACSSSSSPASGGSGAGGSGAGGSGAGASVPGTASATTGSGSVAPSGAGGVVRPTAQLSNGPDLAAVVNAAYRKITSVHLRTTIDSGRFTVVGSGVQQLKDGSPVNSQVTENVKNVGTVELLVIGPTSYAKMPAALGGSTDPAKPWTRVSDSSTSSVSAVGDNLAASSAQAIAAFGHAATQFVNHGGATVNGVRATHYSFTVLVSKLPASFPALATLKRAGVTELPIQLWLDAQGRQVRFIETTTFGGSKARVRTDYDRYDAPVSITAPPAGSVAS